MQNIKKNKILVVVLIILICGFLFISIEHSPPPNLPLTKGEEQGGGLITLEINDVKYESKISEPITVYNFMKKLQDEKKISFKDKTYTGMGEFVEEINGIKNGEKNWIYYVNNKKAEVGISNYKINNGDIVSWKYEKSY